MSKRSLIVRAVFGLFSCLAFGTHVQASSTTVTTVAQTITNDTIDELVVTYTGVPPWSGFTEQSIIPVTSVSFTPSGSTLTSTFSPGITGAITDIYSFTVPVPITTADSTITISSIYFVASGGAHVAPTYDLVAFSSVPEPTSMSMMGIGMAGLFAFRRYFRRSRQSHP
jgi:hypothetical protein